MTRQTDYEILNRSLISFKNIRNEFAHGGNPHITMKSIEENFKAAKKVVKILDKVVS
ncbi:HEPN domain-containing protein [Neobacillus drentensis]|uniref:HEPN domain-containing protein n=1 Tax=Neobacillus drentensis TaxID=220684 RepID=UPI003B589240